MEVDFDFFDGWARTQGGGFLNFHEPRFVHHERNLPPTERPPQVIDLLKTECVEFELESEFFTQNIQVYVFYSRR